MRIPRFTDWLLIAVGLLLAIAVIQPQQLPVVLYKGCLVALGGVVGYWIDRRLFPYARPHEAVKAHMKALSRSDGDAAIGHGLIAALAMMRRAVVVLACVLGLTLGL
ncbi:MAG: hypothetical protein CL543_09105 [Alcanivorax sp.]|nr:hypothetical protein [Alcanivorax sp.]MAY12008.1 hypothetical protein [Alcanivorax sp.]MBI55610.1 hypothetical protein [Alcanivorax sp.]MBU59025.1 hypothetical protein [Alcanivorax sp.]|tara:strand:+ start:564 stop:884 length:321 start_codon:yes stop_codon:yes gene_type:complete